MKHLIFLFLLTIFSVITFAQDYNTIIIDEESEKPMLIGYCTREAFDDTSFSGWWNEEYEMYQVDVETADQLNR